MAPSIGYQGAKLVCSFFWSPKEYNLSGCDCALCGRSLLFQIHSIKIQNEIWKCISYICIALNASESLFHWFCYLVMHVLLMCYILGSPTLGTHTDPPTVPLLTSKTTDYTQPALFYWQLAWCTKYLVHVNIFHAVTLVLMRLWCQCYIQNNIHWAALEQGKMNNAGELDNSKATNMQTK